VWDERRGETPDSTRLRPHAFKALSSERVDDETNKFFILNTY